MVTSSRTTEGPLPAEAGYVKASLWWYDRRHGDNGTTVADIDPELLEYENGSWQEVVDSNSQDDKEFVFSLVTSTILDDRQARLRI